jgi:hypothetical protein
MVEAMVGVSVFVVGILGILQLVGKSLSVNQLILSQFTAGHLAGEGIELVKNVVDGQVALGSTGWRTAQQDVIWNGTWEVSLDTQSGVISLNRIGPPPAPANGSFALLSDKQLFVDDSIPEYTYNASNPANFPTTFRRTVSVVWDDEDPNEPGVMRRATIRSRVDWVIRGDPYSIEVDDRFYEWRELRP